MFSIFYTIFKDISIYLPIFSLYFPYFFWWTLVVLTILKYFCIVVAFFSFSSVVFVSFILCFLFRFSYLLFFAFSKFDIFLFPFLHGKMFDDDTDERNSRSSLEMLPLYLLDLSLTFLFPYNTFTTLLLRFFLLNLKNHKEL